MTQSPPRSATIDGAAGVTGPGPYRIHAAAELSGVAGATLRAWERRYRVPIPRRTASAYRLYTAEDVELVRRMRDLVTEGVSPAEAARVVVGSAAPVSHDEHGALDGLELARGRILAATQRGRGPVEQMERANPRLAAEPALTNEPLTSRPRAAVASQGGPSRPRPQGLRRAAPAAR